jgi:hypothetical protein
MPHNPYRATPQRPDDGQSFQWEPLPYQAIRVVRRDQLDSATAQTPGSQRLAAIHREAGIDSPMWGGVFLVEPAARTGIHHHGEQHTIAAYVLSGSSYLRWSSMPPCTRQFPLCSSVASPPGNHSVEYSSLAMDRRAEHFRTNRCQSAQHYLE